MRRILSILLALVLGLAPGLGALPTTGLGSAWSGKADESSLPACCRHNGKHHCAMTPATGETSVSAPDRCPFCPRAIASTAPSSSAVLQNTPESVRIPVERHTVLAIASVAHGTDHRSEPKRGPPAAQIL